MLNVFQHSQENTFTGVSFLINIVVACNLSLSLFKKKFRHWCFPDSYLKFWTTTFLKREKKVLLWEKKYCYKKRGSDIYRKSTYATLFVTSPRFLCFSKELAQFIVTTGCFINRKLSLKVVNHLLLSFDYPWLAKTLTGQTWLIDIYAMLPQNVLFLECFWRSHVYFIRYCNKPTEITRNHSCGRFLEN